MLSWRVSQGQLLAAKADLPDLLQDACYVVTGALSRVCLYRRLRHCNAAMVGSFDTPQANNLLWVSGGAALSALEAQGALLLIS